MTWTYTIKMSDFHRYYLIHMIDFRAVLEDHARLGEALDVRLNSDRSWDDSVWQLVINSWMCSEFSQLVKFAFLEIPHTRTRDASASDHTERDRIVGWVCFQ